MDKYKKVDYTNKRVGMLVGTGRKKRMGRPHGTKPPHFHWEFKCDCGNTVWRTHGNILCHFRKNPDYPYSCGCMTKTYKRIGGLRGFGNKAHGLTNTRIYNIWLNMRARCDPLRARGHDYVNYAGRDIRVCHEWNDPDDINGSFRRFYAWAMENGYNDNLTIDRINGNGNYCPENCRWSTTKVQNNNKRSNRHILYNGTIYTFSELSIKFGVGPKTVSSWVNKGYSANLIIHNLLHPEDRFELNKHGQIVDQKRFQRLLKNYGAMILD